MKSPAKVREPRTYSPRFPARVMTIVALFFSCAPVALAIATAIDGRGWFRCTLTAVVGSAATWLGCYLWFRLVMWSTRRNLRLHVAADGVCREHRANRYLVPWDQVTQVVVRTPHWPFNQTVELHTTEGLALDLHEFGPLDEIAAEIQVRLGKGVPVEYTTEPAELPNAADDDPSHGPDEVPAKSGRAAEETAIPEAETAEAPEDDSLPCLSCGRPLSDDESRCPACGWTYTAGHGA